jgi:hypothetical protein
MPSVLAAYRADFATLHQLVSKSPTDVEKFGDLNRSQEPVRQVAELYFFFHAKHSSLSLYFVKSTRVKEITLSLKAILEDSV